MTQRIHWDDLHIGRSIGRGQAGEVTFATLVRDVGGLLQGTPLALKTYKSWVLDQPGQYERMFREYNVGRSLTHPNLVRTYGLVQSPSGVPALLMRYYEGPSLDTWIKTHGPPDVNQALLMVRQLAGAMVALHTAGVYHRDVKPANIVVTAEGPVLMDLGVVLPHMSANETTTAQFLGTLRYAAPEYLFGAAFDASADTYSLGAVAYEILTGQDFFGESQHWAHLVARKGDNVDLDYPTIRHSLVARLSRQADLRTADFVRLLVDAMIARDQSRRPDMTTVLSLLQREVWNQPFHLDKAGTVVEGYSRDDLTYNANPGGTLPEAVMRWRAWLSAHDFEQLRSSAASAFLSGYEHIVDIDPELMDRFSAHGLIVASDDNHPGTCTMHENVLLAYRDGLLEGGSRNGPIPLGAAAE